MKILSCSFRLAIVTNPQELPFTMFLCSIKNCLKLPEKTIQICFPFPTTYLCDARFSLYTPTN